MASARSGSKPATDPPEPDFTSAGASARRRAIVAGHEGDLSTAIGLTGLDDPSVRQAALGAVVRANGLDFEVLRSGIHDSDWVVRRRACEIAGRAPRGELALGDVVALLTDAVGDPEALVAEAAIWALGEVLGSADALSAQEQRRLAVNVLGTVAGDHEDPLCREAAVAALGAIGAPESLDAVIAALSDKPPIRRRATVALAAFDDARAESALETCLEDRDWQVRQAAEDLLRPRQEKGT